jgi:hypothetical protein
MGYNKRIFLQKIIEVQNIVLREQERGYLNQKEIFYRLIKPAFFISERTFYNYLARNAKRELSEMNRMTA